MSSVTSSVQTSVPSSSIAVAPGCLLACHSANTAPVGQRVGENGHAAVLHDVERSGDHGRAVVPPSDFAFSIDWSTLVVEAYASVVQPNSFV